MAERDAAEDLVHEGRADAHVEACGDYMVARFPGNVASAPNPPESPARGPPVGYAGRRASAGARVHVVLQVLVEELEGEEELRVDVDDVVERDDVRVAQLLEEADLADRRGGHALLLVREADLLQREDAVRPHVAHLVDDAVGALAHLLHLLVLLNGARTCVGEASGYTGRKLADGDARGWRAAPGAGISVQTGPGEGARWVLGLDAASNARQGTRSRRLALRAPSARARSNAFGLWPRRNMSCTCNKVAAGHMIL